jgi:hypothetical protein
MGKKVTKVFKKGLNVATLGISGKLSKLLNPDVPQPPDAPDPAPVADDQASLISNERAMARRRKGGRGSTILSESSKLG